jgi:hypothetical protein
MNRKKLRGLHGMTVRLRPLPRRFDERLGWLTAIDDRWRIEAPRSPSHLIRAINQATGHFVDLSPDNVFEFREPDMIVLKTQLTLTDRQVLSEPVPDPRAPYQPAVPIVSPLRLPSTPATSADRIGALLLGVGLGLALATARRGN